MKLTVLKNDLQNVLLITQKIISKNQSLPILENVLIEAKDNELKITATNIEIFFSYTITASIEKEGIFAIKPDILLYSIKTTENEKNINLELKDNNLEITTKNSVSSIKTTPYEEFPKISESDKLKNVNNTINKDLIINGIKSVYQFTSQSLVKPELSSVFIYQENEDLYFVATDSFRLAEKKIKYQDDNLNKVLIPSKNSVLIVKILESINEDINDFLILIDENQLTLKSSNIFISSRIIEGSFPDYKSIIPKEFKSKAIVLKSDFNELLKKASIFSDKFGKVTLSQEDEYLNIYAHNPDVGEINEKITAKTEGEEYKVNFNYRYLMESTLSINDDSLQISYAGDGKPLLIEPINDKSFKYIVMPMNN